MVLGKSSIFPQLWQGAKHGQSSSIAELIREFRRTENCYHKENFYKLSVFAVFKIKKELLRKFVRYLKKNSNKFTSFLA